MTPHQPRFRLVNPVGRSIEATSQREAPLARGRSSGSGWRALAGASPTLLSTFRQVKGYFLTHRVIHRTSPPSPEVFVSSTVRAQLDAQVYAQSAGPAGRLVDDPAATGHNRPHDVAARPHPRQHHHHSLAHVDLHVRLQPSFGAAVSFLRRTSPTTLSATTLAETSTSRHEH